MNHRPTRGEQREKKQQKRRQMKVSGKSVQALQRVIAKKAVKQNDD